MKFQRIDPDKLTAKQKEIYNFQKAAAILADYGFNCIKLADDWQGADFLADHIDGSQTLRVQLKSRFTVNKKYQGKDLWVNFPESKTWYLIPHDELLRIWGETKKDALASASWKEKGEYHYPAGQVPKDLLAKIADFALAAASEQTVTRSSMTTKHAALQTDVQISESANPPEAANVERPSSGNKWPKNISIRKNLMGRGLVRQFEFNNIRYEVPHDELVQIAGEVTPWLQSPYWINRGSYSTSNPSKDFLTRLRPFALNAG